jgi:hypothetical protein
VPTVPLAARIATADGGGRGVELLPIVERARPGRSTRPAAAAVSSCPTSSSVPTVPPAVRIATAGKLGAVVIDQAAPQHPPAGTRGVKFVLAVPARIATAGKPGALVIDQAAAAAASSTPRRGNFPPGR